MKSIFFTQRTPRAQSKKANIIFDINLKFLIVLLQISLVLGGAACRSEEKKADENFTAFIVDPRQANIEFFWSNADGEIFKSFENVKKEFEKNGKKLRFAMNGGMYQEDQKPLGLFIQNGKTLAPLNRREASGNFYLKPNGVFGVRKDNSAFLVTTENFADDGQIKFATQSGPMLLVDGNINAQFTEKSDNLNIRNGVCVLQDGKVIFAISRRAVNFYDFANYFREAGCRDALYLDGFVSRMYLPEKDRTDLDGDFGVIIAVVE